MDFRIQNTGPISSVFLRYNIATFQQAVAFITQLPYGRNANKENLATVLTDGCGTCSTKHALLKQLATENGIDNVALILCIFKMSRTNMPEVTPVLDRYQLDYIPEAHNYLRINGTIVDCTKPTFSIANYMPNIISETEIQPTQIASHKVAYHKDILQQWLLANPHISYPLDKLFAIREECIAVLAG